MSSGPDTSGAGRELNGPDRRSGGFGLPHRLALFGLACLVSFALGECLLRLLGARPISVNREQVLFWRQDPQLGWHHRPGQEGVFANDKPPFRTHVRINGKGLRDDECAYERTPGRSRILVLGDSFAWGFGVEQEEAFAEVLERRLPDTEVINAGVSGYSTDQELLWLQKEGVKYRPDLVVLTFCGNDEWMNRERLAYYIYYKPWFSLEHGQLQLHGVPVPRASPRTRFIYFLRRHSALARGLLEAVGAARRSREGRSAGRLEDRNGGLTGRPSRAETRSSRREDAPATNRDVPARDGPISLSGGARGAAGAVPPARNQPDGRPRLEVQHAAADPSNGRCALTRALIRQIAETAAGEGARFMIVANGLAWDARADETYAEFIDALRRDGWAVMDVDSLAGFDAERMTIRNDGHWNAAGHRFVAEELLRKMREQRLTPPPLFPPH